MIQRPHPRLDRVHRHPGAGHNRGEPGYVPRCGTGRSGNAELLAAQAVRFGVRIIAVKTEAAQERRALGYMGNVLTGLDETSELLNTTPADAMLNAIPGTQGLDPTLHTLAACAQLALANKKSWWPAASWCKLRPHPVGWCRSTPTC
ncbi:hypothetical protein [Saccharopolyspora shandongensis]|uniref:hypothetical protein n=1 Tax=Saccharopolyspora shandongensis TaxID=418495 RepID=UPI003F4CE693